MLPEAGSIAAEVHPVGRSRLYLTGMLLTTSVLKRITPGEVDRTDQPSAISSITPDGQLTVTGFHRSANRVLIPNDL